MKTRMIIAALCAIALSIGFASTSFAGIAGSPHDLSGMVAGETRLCAFCHTPHHAVTLTGNPYAPLWSRADASAAGYAQYASSTFDATVTDQLMGPSRLCMSCHDGVVAIDSYYGQTGTIVDNDDTWGGIAVGFDQGLANDHPIGFAYDNALLTADGELKDPTTSFFLDAAGANTSLQVADVLYNPLPIPGPGTFLTCASCHDVHDTESIDAYFLYGSQTGSGICLSCHDK